MGIYRADQLGLSSASISRRTKSGKLLRVLPAVYATEKPDYPGLCKAVTLWKPEAVLSHTSAAWMWDMLDREPQQVTATLPPSAQRRAPDWVVIHRRHLSEKCVRYGLHVVTRAQTFVDVAGTLTGKELEQFFDSAIRTPADRREIVALCEQSRGMTGMKMLRKQLRKCVLNTLSEVERVVGRAMSAKNFFMEINARVGRFFGDFVDFRARVIVEIDGREFHILPEAFNSDRRRQNILMLEGWLILRYSAVQAMGDTDRVVKQIMGVVRKRRRSILVPGTEWPFS